jgi:predicted regulator of Ras-like GTPase activity (Roadblock/LC7/MglB family)
MRALHVLASGSLLACVVVSLCAGVALAQDGLPGPVRDRGGGYPVDFLWTVVAGILVFWMQAGFAMVEAGFTRAKNAVNILISTPDGWLGSLRDVEGVYGSFALSADGAVLASDLPRWMEHAHLDDAGARLARLRETLAPDRSLDWCAIRFTEHKLFLRSAGDRILCVLASAGTDATALKMAATPVSRRLGDAPFVERAPIAPEPPTTVEIEVDLPRDDPPAPIARAHPPRTTAPPPFAKPGTVATDRVRTYRGRRVDP